MTVETDPQAVHRAVLVLEDALEQEYPGEWLDQQALRVVLARLAALETIKSQVARLADQMDEDAIGINGTESLYLPSAAAELRRVLGEA
jgi:hypothetical protein